MNIILASTSPYRRQLLQRLRLPFECIAPLVDEEAFKYDDIQPAILAETLAVEKAKSIARTHPDAIVIGSDQVAECDGVRLDKPGTTARAIEQLTLLSGQSHRLFTSLCVMHRGEHQEHIDVTTLRMRSLTHDEIERYIATDQPLDCAGSYKLESLGIALFESIASDDQTAITGLPLLALCRMLREFGVEVL